MSGMTSGSDRPGGADRTDGADRTGGADPTDRAGAPATLEAQARDSATQAIAYGLVAALACGLLLFGFAALLSFSAGLVVIAFFLGRIVGLSVVSGAQAAVPSAARPRAGSAPAPRAELSGPARTVVAVVLSVLAISGALVATWLYGRSTGGVLGLGDYLAQTLGPIAPLEYIVATLAAWWSSR